MNHKCNPLLGLIVILAFFAGCASPKVLVPPIVDLKSYGRIGIVQFSCNVQGNLDQFATQKFIEFVQTYQPGTPIIELAPLQWESTSQALGEIRQKFGIDGVIVGDLHISNVKPSVNISSFIASMNVRADVEAVFMVKLYETQNGATLWTRSSNGNESVAQVSFSKDGRVYFSARDPEKAYGHLVYTLIDRAAYDLRPHYVRQK
jgi:hypothetical protein